MFKPTTNKVFMFIITLSLLALSIYSGYEYYDYKTIDNYIIKNYVNNETCNFANNNYSISHNRLKITAYVVNHKAINDFKIITSSQIELYYPIIYIGDLTNNLHYEYEKFHNELKGKNFTCRVNMKTETGYFDDYKVYPDFAEFNTLQSSITYFFTTTILLICLFICSLTGFIILCKHYRNTRYGYYVIS